MYIFLYLFSVFLFCDLWSNIWKNIFALRKILFSNSIFYIVTLVSVSLVPEFTFIIQFRTSRDFPRPICPPLVFVNRLFIIWKFVWKIFGKLGRNDNHFQKIIFAFRSKGINRNGNRFFIQSVGTFVGLPLCSQGLSLISVTYVIGTIVRSTWRI